MLSNEKITFYRERLEKVKKDLLAEIGDERGPESFGHDIDGLSEEADEAEQYGNKLSVDQAIKERINEIDGALNKIQLGSYGICEGCGGAISEKVLDVVPESKLCENCKAKEK